MKLINFGSLSLVKNAANVKTSSFESEDLYSSSDEDDSDELEEDEIEIDCAAFAQDLLRFSFFPSSFKSKDPEELFDELAEEYENESLTEAQDYAFELALHLQDQDSPFNLSGALECWSKEDSLSFLALVKEKININNNASKTRPSPRLK